MTARSIVMECDLPQRVSAVWRAITVPDLIARWLMSNDFVAKVGHKFTMTAQPVPGWDGTVHCEVLELEKERRLVYSWRGADLDSVVTIDLSPLPSGGTHFRLEHSGFRDENAYAFQAMGKGWLGHIRDRLREVAATA